MAEYYAVLSKAIGGLTNASPDTRRAVYDKARNALISQLKAIAPPLPTTEISRQRLELEEAIRRVEREIQTGVLPVVSRREMLPPEPPPPVALPPMDIAAQQRQAGGDAQNGDGSRRTPQQIFRQAILDAEGGGRPAPERPALKAPERPAPASRPVIVDRRDTPADSGARAGGGDDARGRGYAGSDRGNNGPRLAPEYGEEAESGIRPPVERGREMRRGPAPIDPEIDDVAPARRAEPEYAMHEPRRRRSRAPLLIFVLLLLVAGGLAYAGWTERTTIRSLIASFEPAAAKPGASKPAPTAAATVAAGVDPAAAAASNKNGDRLLPPGQTAPDKNVRVVGGSPGTTAGAPSPAGSPTPTPSGTATVGAAAPGANAPVPNNTLIPPVGGNATAGPATKPPAGAPAPAGQQQAALPAPGTPNAATPAPPAPAQTSPLKATLYEEPSNPSVAATSTLAIGGTVTWTFAPTSADGPEVIGTVTIPDRKMTVTVTIHRNSDTSLPASHLVEVKIVTGVDFPGKSVQSVPSLVLKQTEDAKGDPLVGASATVASGYFWVALSSAQRDLTTNLGLMQSRSWMDIRLVYATGQRAILTLQEGPDGQQAFARAIAAWG